MHTMLILLAGLAIAPDTLPADSLELPPRTDSLTAPNLAPTLDNLSLLGSALGPGAGQVGMISQFPGRGFDPDTEPRRARAIEHSDAYYTRLKIHRLASYLTVPLFAAQYVSGRALWKNPDSHGLARDAHGPLAASIAGLFAVNTVTGVWNLLESRKDPGGTRRWVHGLLMIAADAGFVAVGATAPDDDFRENGGSGRSSGASTHRDLAIGSMGVALSSYLMMLLWK